MVYEKRHLIQISAHFSPGQYKTQTADWQTDGLWTGYMYN